mmetsp:Transcript_43750/g.72710  ORF Transcript_43750/g.72710 Transcript_43750/m.72710 type:complete len:200 (+) Transcript_43750:32-631(+)|eukprot:CAMPEP_0119304008 /NCGR_PEP_ID=MMETSP1333-20130426/5332_1 /TAXON_ID=418940 /ORGANISM="Scyphosphaera apsteinii, Strain RCC1455" /LENGTH=199 /DNA_ID=CAMNT_0007306807 /DNA_START=32 /DNA_END=631 /DNA_ORIENTATION=+
MEDMESEPQVDERMGPILEAAEQGKATIMGTLFDMYGLPVDTPGEDGDSALHIGCLYGQKAVVEECLRRGASVTARDEDSSTPLHDACAGGYYEIAKLLVDHGALVDAQDNDGESPLHLAANGGHGAVAEFLLTHAKQMDRNAAARMLFSKNALGQTPLDLAREGDDPTLVQRLQSVLQIGSAADGNGGAGGPRSKRRA